jgi:hypothetical protein
MVAQVALHFIETDLSEQELLMEEMVEKEGI